ncbi:ATP-binding protein [Halobacteriovorax sp. HLS]|uniref:sensor histidine kinase n=1 Tax=Halobacteriovorax sp. HLS TaxID=2234000 RepID=UPI000FD740C0|nr:ATP-binding protein [Halobacteriovorax sp. HLS]
MKSIGSKIFYKLISIVLGLLLFFIVSQSYWSYKSKLQLYIGEWTKNSQIIERVFNARIKELSNDTEFVADLSEVQKLVDYEIEDKRLYEQFSKIMTAKEIYKQIRIVSFKKGREVFRINYSDGKVSRVKGSELQQKEDEIYFKELKSFSSSDVYLSPVNFNKENNEFSRPLSLMLRSAKILYTKSGTPYGFIVINMSLHHLFHSFETLLQKDQNVLFMNSLKELVYDSNNRITLDDKTNTLTVPPKEFLKLVQGLGKSKMVEFDEIEGMYYTFGSIEYGSTKLQQRIYVISSMNKVIFFKKVLGEFFKDLLPISIMFIIVVTITYFTLRRVFRPIAKLGELVSKYYSNSEIGAQKYDNEVEAISDSLIQLSEKLIKSNQDLKFQKDALDVSAIVAETDSKGVITYVNDKFCEVSGYEKHELIGRTHRVVNSGFHSQSFFRDFWKTLNEGRVWSGVIKNRTKEGEYYWVDSTIVPFLDKNGQIVKFISIRFDITREHQQKMKLTEANSELKKFNYIVSHDLRSPLVTIGGFSKVLRTELKDILNKKQDRFFERITYNISVVDSLLCSLQDFSMALLANLKIEKIDTRELLKEVLSQVEVELVSVNGSVDIQIECSYITGDKTKIMQVLSNLIINSIKYKSNERKLRLILRVTEEDGSCIFEVIDNGVGLEDDELDIVFDIFKQVGDDYNIKGKGIGLAICKEIVLAHHGEIWTSRCSPFGICVTFKIPVVNADSLTPLPEAS